MNCLCGAVWCLVCAVSHVYHAVYDCATVMYSVGCLVLLVCPAKTVEEVGYTGVNVVVLVRFIKNYRSFLESAVRSTKLGSIVIFAGCAIHRSLIFSKLS